MYRLTPEQQLSVVHLLVEGNSIRSTERLTRIHRDTIMRLLVQVGTKCREFLDRRMRDLHLQHVECDEIWTFVKKKQGRLSQEQAADTRIGDQYLFVGQDQNTKLIPTFVLGKRTAENAQLLMRDLSERIVTPMLHEPGPRPQISTDGFNAYPLAVDLAFANTVNYGVIVKDYQESEQPGRYGPPEMTGALRLVINGNISRFSICTSHVERNNLTIRTFMKRFTRLALGFSKKLENLAAAVALFIAYFDYCWMPSTLSGTPAMAARIAGHPWTLQELLVAL